VSDSREEILVRLQACIATLAPGVVYTFPGGRTHRPIETDLGGRCYSKVRPEASFDSSELPAVELLTNNSEDDTIREVADDDTYLADMKVQIFGYLKSDDAGDEKDAVVRAKLNAFRADLIVAVEAFPYWTSAEYPEPIRRRVGEIETVLQKQMTEAAINAPDGFLTLDYAIRYRFSRLNP
jgi:hypothetical protein